MSKDTKEATVIERIIYYSLVIIQLKSNLRILKDSLSNIKQLSIKLYESELILPKVILDIEGKILYLEQIIKELLLPLFLGISMIGYEDRWAISRGELTKGYIELETLNHKRYVIILSDYKDDRFDIKAGELKPMGEVYSMLGNLRNMNANPLIKIKK